MTNPTKENREKLFHITKRDSQNKWFGYAVRGGAFLLSILICAIISTLLTHKSMGNFFVYLFEGAFGSERKVWNLLHNTAFLLLIALAITPAFKMKFWNIGAEGQVLVGALACAACIQYLGNSLSEEALIPVMLVASMAGGAIWSVIPALFKAKWNTNETLFTLMMNYIATCFTAFCIATWASKGSGTLTFKVGFLPDVVNQFLLKIIVAVVVMALMYVYLRFSKHGYEISVVGESENTARYIGINVKKVIIRTMILCGVLCGLVGFLLVAGTNHSIHQTDTVEGRGFTAILVSWLAKFNPLTMGLTALLVVFVQKGTGHFAMQENLGSAPYSNVMTGIFFILIIAAEFFVNYRVVFRKSKKTGSHAEAASGAESPAAEGAPEDRKSLESGENRLSPEKKEAGEKEE